MDLNRLTRDADDLIRKVVSRYNQLYGPAGNISQLELDLMLDDMRKLYDTFKIIGQVNLTLNQNTDKPEVSVNSTVPSELHHKVTTTPVYSDKPSLSAKLTIEQPDPEPEPIQKPEPETEPETMAEPISDAESDTIEAPETPVLKEKETEIAVPPEQATELSNENPFTAESEISESENSVQKISEKNTASLNPEPSPAMLADRFSTGNKSLSETMASSQAQGVAGSRLLFHPIADLLSGIGLNDKFSFISELFGNNPLHYEEAITRINKAVNVDEANWILQKYHTPEWDQKTDTLNRLKDFVKRRFI